VKKRRHHAESLVVLLFFAFGVWFLCNAVVEHGRRQYGLFPLSIADLFLSGILLHSAFDKGRRFQGEWNFIRAIGITAGYLCIVYWLYLVWLIVR